MDSEFGPEFFAGNRQKLRTLFMGTAPVVLSANGQLQKSSDTTFPFRQDSSFWYLTGLDTPDAILVMDKSQDYLILPELSEYQKTFDGSYIQSEIVAKSGIKTVYEQKEGWKILENRLKKVKHVATLAALPPYVDVFGMYANPARAALIARIKEINPDTELLDLRQHLSRLRMIKQLPELKSIQKAINLTVSGLKSVKRHLNKYQYEYELEADLMRHFIKAGAGSAWKPTIASGLNACQLHYNDNNSKLKTGNLVYADVGADFDHYASDITRTWAYGKNPTRRQEKIHAAVLEVQDYAIELLKPGTVIRSYEQQIEHFMGEKLRALGLIKTIDKENVRQFFTHATSHFLGIDPHDAGDYDRPLEPGVVVTVEPGIYIPKEGIGIRIEDDVLITKNGNKILSAKLPRGLV